MGEMRERSLVGQIEAGGIFACVSVERGGQSEGFGNVLVEFALNDAVIVIARDRTQWMLDVGVVTCPPFDLDLVCRAQNGHDHWEQWGDRPLPDQLPPGVSWRDELPRAIGWLRSTSDARGRLEALGRSRAAQTFGRLPDG